LYGGFLWGAVFSNPSSRSPAGPSWACAKGRQAYSVCTAPARQLALWVCVWWWVPAVERRVLLASRLVLLLLKKMVVFGSLEWKMQPLAPQAASHVDPVLVQLSTAAEHSTPCCLSASCFQRRPSLCCVMQHGWMLPVALVTCLPISQVTVGCFRWAAPGLRAGCLHQGTELVDAAGSLPVVLPCTFLRVLCC
jgi:hypothetical protein